MTDAEKIKQLETENNVLHGELSKHYDVPKIEFLTDKVGRLEAENLVMREALAYYSRVGNRAWKALRDCSRTAKLQRQREADLKVVEAAKKHWPCNGWTVCELCQSVSNRERVYGEGK